MVFDDWKDKEISDMEISSSLLWDYDIENFDWEKGKILVVQRVIERGWRKDYYIVIHKYGGLDNFIEIIKQIPHLNKIDTNYVSKAFKIDLNELKCYKNKQRREQLINSWSE